MKTIYLLAALVALSGCTSIKKKADGSWSYVSALSRKSAKRVIVASPDGSRITLEGYQNDQVEAAGVIAEGVARGVVNGGKGPLP